MPLKYFKGSPLSSSLIFQKLSLTLTQGCKIMVLCLFYSPSLPSLLLLKTSGKTSKHVFDGQP